MKKRPPVRLFALHSFLSRLYFFLPILVLWLRGQGFDQFQVTLLLSLFFLSTTLAEIPTGILSDRLGHRYAMSLCGLFQAAGVFLLAFASHLPLAIIGEVLMGIGQAFYTGSKEAYLFNTLQEDDSHDHYQRDYSQAKFFEFIGMALGSLIGGSLFAYWPRLPFFLSAAAFLLAALVALLLLREAPRVPSQEGRPTLDRLVMGLKEIRNGPPRLHRLIVYYCLLFSGVLVFIVTLIQPYLKEAGVPLPLFGAVFLFFQVSSMGGSLAARNLPEKWITPRFFALLAGAFSSSLVGLALVRHPTAFLLGSVIYFVWGIFLPTLSHAINKLIRSENRATVLSTQDFFQHSLFILIAPLLGLTTDRLGMTAALLGLSLLGLLAVPLGLSLSQTTPSTENPRGRD